MDRRVHNETKVLYVMYIYKCVLFISLAMCMKHIQSRSFTRCDPSGQGLMWQTWHSSCVYNHQRIVHHGSRRMKMTTRHHCRCHRHPFVVAHHHNCCCCYGWLMMMMMMLIPINPARPWGTKSNAWCYCWHSQHKGADDDTWEAYLWWTILPTTQDYLLG